MGDHPDEPCLLVELVERPAWMADAACREHPELNYFPERGEALEPAKAVCRSCLVAEECLSYALEHDELHGIWGGMAPGARRELRKAQRAA